MRTPRVKSCCHQNIFLCSLCLRARCLVPPIRLCWAASRHPASRSRITRGLHPRHDLRSKTGLPRTALTGECGMCDTFEKVWFLFFPFFLSTFMWWSICIPAVGGGLEWTTKTNSHPNGNFSPSSCMWKHFFYFFFYLVRNTCWSCFILTWSVRKENPVHISHLIVPYK